MRLRNLFSHLSCGFRQEESEVRIFPKSSFPSDDDSNFCGKHLKKLFPRPARVRVLAREYRKIRSL